ncbi:MAG: MBOAT family O-acyltransferase [Eubacteriales bacterium]|nr:MBOAT family O-acyltransferase [Eubacteriales bacterium]
MTFLSGSFFVFILAVVLLYYIMPLKGRWVVLLLASILFYLSWGWKAFAVVLFSSLLVYLSARWMEKIYARQSEKIKNSDMNAAEKKKCKQQAKKKCHRILIFTGFVLVIVLAYSKIGQNILDGISRLTGEELPVWMQVLVPLGISYYTFSMLSYLADVYWKKDKAEHNFLKFLLFVLFFPKILQGPISRHRDLADQLNEGHAFDYTNFCFGIQLALWGYFKKLVIADRLSIFVDSVFLNCYDQESSLIFVIAAMFASVELYCDFSGCMDMARGISQMLGIELEQNFEHPFFSRSAGEFWRRWHATLGEFFKNYVYMPVAISPALLKLSRKIKKTFGSRASKSLMVIVPLVCVWTLSGLWHGTGYNYIIWGIYWAVLTIVPSVFAPEINKMTSLLKINTEARSWHIFQMVRTFLLFSFGRLLTVPGHIRTSLDILKQIAAKFDVWILFDESLYNYGLNRKNFWVAMAGIFVLWCVSMLQERGSVREMIARNNAVVRWTIYYLAFFAVIIFGVWGAGYSNTGFTYMNY